MREWRDVRGFEDRYEVSNDGLVRTKPRILKPWQTTSGHLTVSLSFRKRAYVHRLVAEAFIENSAGKPLVNHKNSNPADNCVENLEWATASENLLHGWRQNPKPHYADKAVVAFDEFGEIHARYPSTAKAAKALGVSPGAIHSARKRGGKCCGFFWRYA